MTAASSPVRIRIARTAKADAILSPRRLAGFITAGAVTLSLILAMALPARAGDRSNDLAKALIAALVIGAIVHESKRDAPAPAPIARKTPVPDTRIPAVCALEFEGEQRSVIVYPESCLRDEGVRGRLPTACAKVARIYGQRDHIYSERCLRDAGFTLPRTPRRH